MKILFFIDSLATGGKERRLLELIYYLKRQTEYEISVVLLENIIHYDYVSNLDIDILTIQRKRIKKDPLIFIKFYRYCLHFKPDIIHTWGIMNTFYAIPSKLILRVKLVTSMIAASKRLFTSFSFVSFLFHVSCYFSDAILSNSVAGLREFNVKTPNAKVIYNGVRLERFQQEIDMKIVRRELGVKTDFILIMVASFTEFKDFDLFLDVAKKMGEIRNDVTFIAVGDGSEFMRIQQRVLKEHIDNVILTGRRLDVESIVAVSDIGVLFTNTELHGEGISNSIIEYMALGKPVITTDIYGGSKEIVLDGETGYCINGDADKITLLMDSLLNNEAFRILMGNKGKDRINSHFSIDRMGKEFEIVYKDLEIETSINRRRK